MKRMWMWALIGGLIVLFAGCSGGDGSDGYNGGTADSAIVSDSTIVPVECWHQFGISARGGRASVGGTTMEILPGSQVWWCSPVELRAGIESTITVGTRLSWQDPGSTETRTGILEEMPMVVLVR